MNTLERKFKKLLKNQKNLIYAIYHSRSLFINPNSAFALVDKGIAKKNSDGSVSLTKHGIDFLKIILYEKGEEYIKRPKPNCLNFVTI